MSDLVDRVSKARLAGALDSKIVEIVREHTENKLLEIGWKSEQKIRAEERQRCIDVVKGTWDGEAPYSGKDADYCKGRHEGRDAAVEALEKQE